MGLSIGIVEWFLSPLAGLRLFCRSFPRLTPRATLCRHSVAPDQARTGRQAVAHGASRGYRGARRSSPVGTIETSRLADGCGFDVSRARIRFLSLLTGLDLFFHRAPRLTPWALSRHSVAPR